MKKSLLWVSSIQNEGIRDGLRDLTSAFTFTLTFPVHILESEGRILLRESSQGESSGLRVRLEGSLKTHYDAYELSPSELSLSIIVLSLEPTNQVLSQMYKIGNIAIIANFVLLHNCSFLLYNNNSLFIT